MKKDKINSNEVAALAGVSRSTVSRVINNYSNVPPKTREKVLKAIKELNYYPNVSAQMLAGKNSRTIGLFIITSAAVDVLTNMMIASVMEAASDMNYYVLTYIIRDINDETTQHNVREMFHQSRIDGGIFIALKRDEPFINELVADGFVIGVFDQERNEKRLANHIPAKLNNDSGIKQAIAYLIGLGHRKIGIVNGDLSRLSGLQRYEGFLSTMGQYGLEVNESWVLASDFNEAAAYEAMDLFLQGGAKELPTAWIAANDSEAFGVIRALNKHGLHVPDHMSVIGFDDHLLSERFLPPLTTIRVDFKQLFTELMQLVIKQVEEPTQQLQEATCDSTLIIRASCRRLDE